MIPGLLSLVLDLAVIGLLVATIIYAVRLNRQLSAVKESRAELEELIKGFAEATAQADSSVKGMRKAATESGEALSALITRARTLKDEMELIVHAADDLANRLEAASGKARQTVMPTSTAPAPALSAPPRGPALSQAAAAPAARSQPVPASPATGAEPRSRAEKELLQALENLRP
ncbi:DUF6468 domain-containing protein [Niveispirillum irakense]|uniref:DUF6468 domain-containing protein n=1 Tax=Niveispirillum irakense TaxID=34011 RepID=UPI00041AD07F|nr:DUF6468 domain-containing protein [Niveispirillum irakense]